MKTLLKFESTNCAPCRQVQPYVDKLVQEYDLKLVKINVDEEWHKTRQYNVRALPTLVLLDESKTELAKSVGTALTEIKKRLQRV